MSDRRRHRGPNPLDEEMFHARHLDRLKGATDDLCWLLSRGSAQKSSLKLVGDHFRLTERQRIAVGRCACADSARMDRTVRELGPGEIRDRSLAIDGFNVLTTVEAALSNGVLLLGRDGCLRDMVSLHGAFRRVEETLPAVDLLLRHLESLGPSTCRWLLDAPVSNSGRLAQTIRDQAGKRATRTSHSVELVPNPDPVLKRCRNVVVTADRAILDRRITWFDLARHVVETHRPGARVLAL